ncbi:hypothetical protein DIURU_004214 [Diutina rugosa]|uniref:ATP-dependent (S)-NAD(P)H-hydrate dehydratase n=1 Tax=Diutina rugosa TaxID=5481 RepID=A0A642UI91_DIURU|nr:uncharacterized protein DIURU_004214 [Diutina rugosa]KAA8899547.1 hypothetical protein DIURU_004214 [Diutina rugosa]
MSSVLKGTPKELLTKCRQLIQPLNANFHKGMAGIITVIGGCADYTGAPYFACHAAAATGADLSHVICERRAAPVIKGYTPDLMIHPYLRDLEGSGLSDEDIQRIEDTDLEKVLTDNQIRDIIDNRVMPRLETLLHRSDVVVVGPGFGRDKLMLASLVRIIEEVKVLNKPVIIDADALYLLSLYPKLGAYNRAVLTPNVVEFARLAKAIKVDAGDPDQPDSVVTATQNVSRALAGAIVVRKGPYEVIASSEGHLINDQKGSPRRVGGQGDTLVGITATLLCWSNHYMDSKWGNKVEFTHDEANILAIYAAANMVRVASRKAFAKYGRAMQTSNVHQFVGEAYTEIFGDAATL